MFKKRYQENCSNSLCRPTESRIKDLVCDILWNRCTIVTPVIVAIKSTLISLSSCIICLVTIHGFSRWG